MSVQPIERNSIKYFLFFEKENVRLQIDKPIGLEKADFEIRQNAKGYGRYLTFADSLDVGFSPRFRHEFKRLCDAYRANRWQVAIYLIIEVDGTELYRGRMKLNSTETDYNYYFKCRIDVNNQREIIEAKKTETIDLLSTKSLDDKDISKVEMVGLLTKFKEIFVDSRVELSEPAGYFLDLGGNYGNEAISVNMFNKAINVGSDVVVNENMKTVQLGWPKELFTAFKAKANNTSVELNLTDIDFTVAFNRDNIPIPKQLNRVIYNADGSVKDIKQLFFSNGNATFVLPESERQERLILNKDELVLYRLTLSVSGIQNLSGGITFHQKPSLQFFTIDRFENTITPACRLIDIGRQCLKSITNDAVTVVAPRFLEPGGNFYDIYATSGLFLRQYEKQPFYATWKSFVDYIYNAFNCDYQIQGNDIFIGHESDFYQDVEMERIKFSPDNNSFRIRPNEKCVKSNFTLGYDKYEDDKASSNTIDSFHVKSEWYLPNSQPLEDARDDFNIGYVADQYKIENTRRESFNKDSTKTIPNDKDIYVIDTIVQDGVLQNRTNQGFLSVENIYSPETCYNLRLSVKRLIMDYFPDLLANISQYTTDGWKNTLYLNNRTAKTQTDSTVVTTQQEIIEGADILPEQLPPPTLTGDVYELDLAYRVKYDEFMKLASKIINERGYITLYTKEGAEIKLYVSNLKYSWENEKIYNIKGERKHA